MKNNKGFTLTEILLAAMIVGLIGIALAALTTSGVREGSVGRTRAMLRNQLSVALRQLRKDIEQSTDAVVSPNGRMLTLTQAYALGPEHMLGPDNTHNTITYTFAAGSQPGAGGGTTGGTLSRNGEVILQNVKFIDEGHSPWRHYPFFRLMILADTTQVDPAVAVSIIVEVASEPVVNDVVEEVFILPQGIPIKRD